MTLQKIISGGQTGADQGALDGARGCGFPHGGSIPAGRKTENGRLPEDYQMEELASPHYPIRTRKNVEDSNGTLIVSHGPLSGGSLLTQQIARESSRPHLHLDFNSESRISALQKLTSWLEKFNIKILNVAGPRASSDPLIYTLTRQLIIDLLSSGKPNVS